MYNQFNYYVDTLHYQINYPSATNLKQISDIIETQSSKDKTLKTLKIKDKDKTLKIKNKDKTPKIKNKDKTPKIKNKDKTPKIKNRTLKIKN